MMKLTLGMSTSSFAANMALKQNTMDFQQEYPLTARATCTLDCFYIGDGLVGANSVDDAIHLRKE